MHEPGSRETAVVLSGELSLVCGGETYDLAEGDSVTFDADLPHHFENPGNGEASFLSVIAAGLQKVLKKGASHGADDVRKDLAGARGARARAERRGGLRCSYIDLHLVHEVTSAQAFEGLRLAGRELRRPDRTLATVDHNVPTDPPSARRSTRSATSSRVSRSPRCIATAKNSASRCTAWTTNGRASSTSSARSWA